ncbi:MAG: hypothetical protein JXB35_04000 [Anaerolineae bacterium]|nr:hypothetical protein [Anaerolineae bacterium]
MRRRQKVFLLILGLADLIVITGLIWVIARPQPPLPPNYNRLAPCEQLVLGQVPGRLSPAIAWSPQRLEMRLRAVYDSPTAPPESAQLIWTALDSLAKAAQTGCTIPNTLSIVLETESSSGETIAHTAQLRGEDIIDWLDGDIDDDTLARQAAYRIVTQATPSEPAPSPTPNPQSRRSAGQSVP